MKHIVIDNNKFPFDIGCRLLKLKHTECPFKELEDIWDNIEPFTFSEISLLENIEQRRVGITCLGIERLVKEINPKLLDKQTIKKETSWVNDDGQLEHIKFNDTYELYQVDGEILSKGIKGWGKIPDSYYVKFKDTSTDREYMIWVDIRSVHSTNRHNMNENNEPFYREVSELQKHVNAIHSIAWTIQTNVPEGQIEKIVRQGDCILIKPKKNYVPKENSFRHLTEKEYRTLLVLES